MTIQWLLLGFFGVDAISASVLVTAYASAIIKPPVLTMRIGVVANGESRIIGGTPPKANTPPFPFLSKARLNIGSMTPCLIIVVRTGSYSSLSPVVALKACVRSGKARPISPLVTLSPSQNAELASPTCVFFAVNPAKVTS